MKRSTSTVSWIDILVLRRKGSPDNFFGTICLVVVIAEVVEVCTSLDEV